MRRTQQLAPSVLLQGILEILTEYMHLGACMLDGLLAHIRACENVCMGV